jgi:hypothetical protein
VRVFLTDFKNNSFDHEEEFKGINLLECRNKAIEYYNERLKGMPEKFFLPFASFKDFEFGKNSAYSVELYFIESYYSDGLNVFEYNLSDKDFEEDKNYETMILREQGYDIDVIK